MTTPGDPNNPPSWGDEPRDRNAPDPPPGEHPRSGGQPPAEGRPGYGERPPEESPWGRHAAGTPPYGGGPPYGGAPPYGQPGGPPVAARPGGGLGTAALVLGIVSLLLLLVCGLGVLTAIAGIIVGIIAVVRKSNKGRAIAGIVLSVLTLIIAIIVFSWFVSNFQECFNLPSQAEAQQCVERKLGVDVQTSP